MRKTIEDFLRYIIYLPSLLDHPFPIRAKLFLFLFILAASSNLPNLYSQNPKLHFKHLSTENGLSGNIISDIIEDNIGYIWIGTTNGLNKFDGYTVTSYYHNPADSSSLPNNEIISFATDRDGDLWIGTRKGLARFNYQNESFERYIQIGPGERNIISKLFVDETNLLWVGTEHGLFLFDKRKETFERITKEDDINFFAPMSMIKYQDGSYVVGTWERGFFRITRNYDSYTQENVLLSGKEINHRINIVESLIVDNNKNIWMATWDGVIKVRGSSELGKEKYCFTKFEIGKEIDGKKDNDRKFHAIIEDSEGRIWMGRENGLVIHDQAINHTEIHYYDPVDPNSLSNNHIKCMYRDRSGNIWLGTYQGGVNFYSPNYKHFKKFFPEINDASNQMMRYVKSIFQDSNDRIWIGTNFGLYQYSESGELQKMYLPNPSHPNALNAGGVTAIHEDKKGRLWVGTWGGGMHKLNPQSGIFERLPWDEHIHGDPYMQGDVNVRSIAEDSQGNLWIGHIRGFLDKYNPETKVFEHFKVNLSDMNVNAVIVDLYIDKEDKVWIGTQGGGLIKFDPITKKLERIGIPSHNADKNNEGLNSTDVYSMHFANDNTIWLGTSNGINILDLKTGKYTYLTVKDGLPSNTVYSIIPDDLGNLWLSTIKGISKYDPRRRVLINYDGREGIRINSEIGYKNNSGWLFFGGVNGINAFNPLTIKENNNIPPIVFSGFYVFNKLIDVKENTFLHKHVNYIEEIVLPHNLNVFSIEFAALNFINSERNRYACKLEGFDKDWVPLGSENIARYTNLNPGKYVFRVIASNNDGLWNETGRTLKITILPPWWSTWWFRLISLIFMFLIVLSWILMRTLRLRAQQLKLKALVVERTAEIEAQKAKLQHQTEVLLDTNQLLIEKQNEVLSQKEAIARQKEKLELKNNLLEAQKNQINQQRAKEQELAQQLHEADQLKLQFFTNISHEFRTPLTLILGPINKLIAENKIYENPEFLDCAKAIKRNSQRLVNLINQFLDLSRFQTGAVTLRVIEGDLQKYLLGILDAYQYIAMEKNISFTLHSRIDSKICYFDADKIEKIIYNLLSNAFKFTNPGGKIDINVNYINEIENFHKSLEYIEIEISDSGIGIETEKLERIFERFYQTPQSSNSLNPGTGIGLALCQELVAVYRGRINVASALGKGTTFTVILPVDKFSFTNEELSSGDTEILCKIKPLELLEEFTSTKSNEVKVLQPMFCDDEKKTILVVDDNPDIRQYIKAELETEFNIIEAVDGEDGLKKAIDFLPKLIISDVMMPKIDGLELCSRIKTDLQTCHIPVIILTAKAGEEDKLVGLETGADAYIPKPFDIRLLESHIRQLLASREQLKQLFQRELIIKPTGIVVESSNEQLINRIIKIISKNLSNPDFGVEELGKEVGLSRTHLYRKIKQITNSTAIEFVRNMRLERAAQLFRQEKQYVAEVTYMCGFKELSYFRKMFKEYFGVSPQEYIAKLTEQPVIDELPE